MKRILAVAVLGLLLAACGTNESAGDPGPRPTKVEEKHAEQKTTEAVEGAFLEWMSADNDGDCEGVKARVTQPDSIDCEIVEEQAGAWEGLVDDEEYLAQYSKVTITQESATMEIEDHTDEVLVWDLERVDGRWLIVSDADDA